MENVNLLFDFSTIFYGKEYDERCEIEQAPYGSRTVSPKEIDRSLHFVFIMV